MSLLAQESLDFVVHVGDYIYETVGAAFQAGAAEPAHAPLSLPDGTALGTSTVYATTLADYRYLYRTYRGDARLQAIHRQWPLVAIWDDHEFSDDCWQDHQTYTNANLQQTARRRAASQAWVEYMPIDFGDVSFDTANEAYDNIRIYRDFQFGDLMHLVMTDERLYRDDHVVLESAVAAAQGHDPINGSDSVGARYFVQQPVLAQFEAARTAALGRVPSVLGVGQTEWWKQTMAGSTATWKVWGNEVMLNRLWADLRALAPPPYNAVYVVNCDSWDGYPSHKADLLGYLKAQGVSNVVAITGDLHAFQCGVVRDVPDPAAGTPVLVDFVSAGISSTSFFRYLQAGAAGTPLASLVANQPTFEAVVGANNPDLKYHDHDAQGYATASVTPGAFVVTYTKVKPLNPDGSAPASPLLKRTRITVASGSTTPVVEDNV
jgi:alkaline phosphatase D